MDLTIPEYSLDYNRSVLEWQIKRNNDKINLDEIRPGSVEAKKVLGYQIEYTMFNNMLRYNQAVVNLNFNHSPDEKIQWDPFGAERLPHSYPNRTAELYAERKEAN